MYCLIMLASITPMFNYKKNLEARMRLDMQKTLGIAEAARKLNVTLKYVYDLVYSGRLPAEKSGRTWRIPASAVEARLKTRGA
jgi:excisionase family DNA binding protein